ncbi:mitochondrial import inner membrane translocase subunit Tim21 [Diorhabda sublineata]|uniref:mitochondrial import inner membrane translocase subunit Tim21 n=1 Tax=Diorhabda sublineata TaxID=1163346 RepID=UPI0024E09BD8|nr:mitochondrial import inner membrane translocase subunit Tim21 [Diorhabda sublineata]
MLPIKLVQTILGRNYRAALKLQRPIIYRISVRCQSTKEKGGSLTTSSSKAELDTNVKPLGEKVKETTKTVSYLGVIAFGLVVTGSLFYAVFNELFSSKSPNNIYSKAVKKCLADTRVEDKLGKPITAYGEQTRRGRRQHVSHVIYTGKDGRPHLRMKFHLKGSFHSGTVNLDMVENDAGDYEYRYMYLQVDDMLKNVIVLEDNRHNSSPTETVTSFEEITY